MSVISWCHVCLATSFLQAWEMLTLCQQHPHCSHCTLSSCWQMMTWLLSKFSLELWNKPFPLETRIPSLNLLPIYFSFCLDKACYYFPPPSPLLLTKRKVIASSLFDEAHHILLQLWRKPLSYWEACILDQNVRDSDFCLFFFLNQDLYPG